MIFNKMQEELENHEEINETLANESISQDDVETVVGPSVNVEGDLSSKGNIIVKGTVTGNVNTSKQLTVEKGAKIVANIKAGQAVVAGEIQGNIKIKESLELNSSSKIIGDISVKTLSVEPGAILYGKIAMPGAEVAGKTKKQTGRRKKIALDV